jgi:hypothetical protein
MPLDSHSLVPLVSQGIITHFLSNNYVCVCLPLFLSFWWCWGLNTGLWFARQEFY